MNWTQTAFVLLIAGLLEIGEAGARENDGFPEVGKPCPNFRLENIHYYDKDNVSLADFRGRWLVLDFWFSGCGTCIASFPKINSLQKQFKDEIQFMMVGLNEGKYGKDVDRIYEKLRTRFGLDLAVAFDSTLFEQWQIHSMPRLIFIDPEGVVQHITDGRDITAEKVRQLLNGKTVTFFSSDRLVRDKTLLPQSVDHDKLLYGAALSKWNNEIQSAPVSVARYVQHVDSTGFNVQMVPLYALYNYAYTGQWDFLRTDSLYRIMYPVPVLELNDSSLFEYDYRFNVGRGTYNYRVTIPGAKASGEQIMTIMQRDLKSTFGFNVAVERRLMPVWTLVATDRAKKKLKSKGGPVINSTLTDSSGGATGFTLQHVTVEELCSILARFMIQPTPPLFDETNIGFPIDIRIDAIMHDLKDVRRALNENGLNLIQQKREMTVLVISESKAL